MHTAIITAKLGHGEFDVIDSNWGYTQQVNRHELDPWTQLADSNSALRVAIWRVGQGQRYGHHSRPDGVAAPQHAYPEPDSDTGRDCAATAADPTNIPRLRRPERPVIARQAGARNRVLLRRPAV